MNVQGESPHGRATRIVSNCGQGRATGFGLWHVRHSHWGAALSGRVTSRVQHFCFDSGLARRGDASRLCVARVCILGSRVRFMCVPGVSLHSCAVHVQSDVFFASVLKTNHHMTHDARGKRETSRVRSPGIVRGAGTRRHSSLRQCACAYRLAV